MCEMVSVFSSAFAFVLVGLSVYLSAHVLKLTDVTCEASVGIGGCCYGALVLGGLHPIFAFGIATLLGACAGFTTASLATHIKLNVIVAGLTTMAAFRTFTVKFCGVGGQMLRGNIPSSPERWSDMSILLVVGITVLLLFYLFNRMISSEYGLAMRVYGDGRLVSESLGIDSSNMLWVGLGISNALAAAGGALIAQINGRFWPSMGYGALIFGFGAIILGKRISSSHNIKSAILMCAIAAFLYKIFIEVCICCIDEKAAGEYEGIITALALILLYAISTRDRTDLGNLNNSRET